MQVQSLLRLHEHMPTWMHKLMELLLGGLRPALRQPHRWLCGICNLPAWIAVAAWKQGSRAATRSSRQERCSSRRQTKVCCTPPQHSRLPRCRCRTSGSLLPCSRWHNSVRRKVIRAAKRPERSSPRTQQSTSSPSCSEWQNIMHHTLDLAEMSRGTTTPLACQLMLSCMCT